MSRVKKKVDMGSIEGDIDLAITNLGNIRDIRTIDDVNGKLTKVINQLLFLGSPTQNAVDAAKDLENIIKQFKEIATSNKLKGDIKNASEKKEKGYTKRDLLSVDDSLSLNDVVNIQKTIFAAADSISVLTRFMQDDSKKWSTISKLKAFYKDLNDLSEDKDVDEYDTKSDDGYEAESDHEQYDDTPKPYPKETSASPAQNGSADKNGQIKG